ncbi:hypothetical protein [Lacinutrix salivirga]
MKKAIVLFQLIVLTSIFSSAQIASISGSYSLISSNSENLKRTLLLNADGTFEFHNYEYHAQGIPPEKNSYGKGAWVSNKNIISFFAEESDFNEKFTLDFNNTKARFHTKSPRDKSNRNIKTTIRFYNTEIFWIKGMTLVKTDN